MSEAVQDFLRALGNFLPKLLAFLAILIVGYFIAKLLQKLINKLLEKVGFDRVAERGGVTRILQNSQLDASDILAKIVFYAVMLFVLSTAFGVFGDNPISDYLAAIIGYLPKIFVAILILVIAAAVAAGAKLLIQNTLGGLTYGRTLGTIASVFILALGVIAALNQLEIAQNVVNAVLIASLATLVGIAVVAVGGGGIVPMRQRWENALTKVESEAPNVRRQVKESASAMDAIREEAQTYRQGGAGAAGAVGQGEVQGAPQGYQPSYGVQGGQPPPPDAPRWQPSSGGQGGQPSYGGQGGQSPYGNQGGQSSYGDQGGQSPSYGVQSGQSAYDAQGGQSAYDAQGGQSPSYGVQGGQPPQYDVQGSRPQEPQTQPQGPHRQETASQPVPPPPYGSQQPQPDNPAGPTVPDVAGQSDEYPADREQSDEYRAEPDQTVAYPDDPVQPGEYGADPGQTAQYSDEPGQPGDYRADPERPGEHPQR